MSPSPLFVCCVVLLLKKKIKKRREKKNYKKENPSLGDNMVPVGYKVKTKNRVHDLIVG